jgi:hypothetical protein
MHGKGVDSVTGSNGMDVDPPDGATQFSIEDQPDELPNGFENGEEFDVGWSRSIEGMGGLL